MAFDERDYARKRAEQRMQSSWYKLREGENCFRILPVPKTETVKTNFYEYGLHREVGPQKISVRCGVDAVSGQGECWICDKLIPYLKKKKMEQRALALQPKAVTLMQVAKVDEELKMTGPFLFTPAKTLGDQLLASIFGGKKRSYLDPVRGYNLNVHRTGTGRNDTKYGIITPDEDPTQVPKALLDKVKPFEELKEVPVYSQAKQQAAYNGKPIEEEAPAPSSAEEPRQRRRPAVVQEEADDELVDDELTGEGELTDELVDDDALDGDGGDDELLDEEPPAPPARTRPAARPAASPAARRQRVVEPEPETELEEAGEVDDLDIPDDDIDLDGLDDEISVDDEPLDEQPPPRPRAKPIVGKPAATSAPRAPAPRAAAPAARAAAPAQRGPHAVSGAVSGGLKPKVRR